MSGRFDFEKFNTAGAVTGRTTSDKSNFTEVEKQSFPDAQFGSASEEESVEAELPEEEQDTDDDDDEELDETPPDVVAMLGFDPKEEETPEEK